MTRRLRRPSLAALPLAIVLGAAALPAFFLLVAGAGEGWTGLDASSLPQTLGFAAGGAAVATLLGAVAGMLAGTLALPGARFCVVGSCVLAAAPPAFWWLGSTRLPAIPWSALSGPAGGSLVAGIALAPVPLLLVHAALREMPANLYEAARAALSPARRVAFVLLPLLRAPLTAGFLLVVVLLLGESEVPFLFGFRTTMTDVVTLFSRTFDVRRVVPLVLPLQLLVLLLGAVATRPLLRTVISTSRGAHGVVRKPARPWFMVVAGIPIAVALCGLGGYAYAAVRGLDHGTPEAVLGTRSLFASIAEPVTCAWLAACIIVVAGYAQRGTPRLPWFLWVGLLLFCTPGAIHALGWIVLSQALGGPYVPPGAAHLSRVIGLPLLGFAIAHSRVPVSLEHAARLVPISPGRRALAVILPLLAPSLAAGSALVAGLVFADRDVASLMLAPGSSRLMLDLYLLSANATSAKVGSAALAACAGATVAVLLGGAGPLFVLRRRG